MDADLARATIATQRPRRLRLGELLRELGARTQDDHADVDPDAPLPPRREHLTVGELVDRASEGGFGFLIGVLALIAIPFFGLSTPFGLAISLLGAQLMIGRGHPWLPRAARRREVSMAMLDRVAGLLAKRTRWIARSTRRRWEPLIMPRAIGGGVLLLALGLALPLPIPGSNLMFLIPLLVYAIGILERDGMWIAIGHLCLAVDLALLTVFGGALVAVLQRVVAWIA